MQHHYYTFNAIYYSVTDIWSLVPIERAFCVLAWDISVAIDKAKKEVFGEWSEDKSFSKITDIRTEKRIRKKRVF